MARYEHLPIYRSAMKLAVYLETTVRGFPRYAKYTLGTEMRASAQRIVGLVISANEQRDRRVTLVELRQTVEQLLVQARICQETSGFRNFKSFATTVELAGEVARQNEGWLKSCGTRGAPEPSANRPTGVR